MSDAPRWPGWTIPVVLLGSLVAITIASAIGGLLSVLAGADAVTPGAVTIAALLSVAALWLLLKLVASRAGIDLAPRDLGLRRVRARLALVVLAFGVLVAAAAGGLTALLADVDLEHPPDLGEEGDLVTLEPGLAVSVLGRAVLVAVAIELVLRGFALPALAQRFGRTAAVAALTVLGGLLAGADPELIPAYAVISTALCVMYIESGSIAPGIALQSGVSAHFLAISIDWTVPEAIALAVPAAAIGFALAWSWDRGPRRS